MFEQPILNQQENSDKTNNLKEVDISRITAEEIGELIIKAQQSKLNNKDIEDFWYRLEKDIDKAGEVAAYLMKNAPAQYTTWWERDKDVEKAVA